MVCRNFSHDALYLAFLSKSSFVAAGTLSFSFWRHIHKHIGSKHTHAHTHEHRHRHACTCTHTHTYCIILSTMFWSQEIKCIHSRQPNISLSCVFCLFLSFYPKCYTLTQFIPSNFRGINLSGPSNFQCWAEKRLLQQNKLEKKTQVFLSP